MIPSKRKQELDNFSECQAASLLILIKHFLSVSKLAKFLLKRNVCLTSCPYDRFLFGSSRCSGCCPLCQSSSAPGSSTSSFFPVCQSNSRRPGAGNASEERAPQQEEEEAEGRRSHELGHRQEDQGRDSRNARPAEASPATETRSRTSPASLRAHPEAGAAEARARGLDASSDRAQMLPVHQVSSTSHGESSGLSGSLPFALDIS